MRIRTHIGYQNHQKINNFQELDHAQKKQKDLYMVIFDGQPLNLNQDIAKAPQGNVTLFSKCERWMRKIFRLPVKNQFIQLELGSDIPTKTIRKTDPLAIQTDLERYIKQSKVKTPVWTDPKKAKEYTIAIQLEYIKRAQFIADRYATKMAKKEGLPTKAVRIRIKYLPLPKLARMPRAIPKATKAYKKYRKEMKGFL